ncbi:MAG TPA: SDR family NAD(P)-dependent oxidoreductase [Chitinophagales bacterium]|nr:SDR family NAD(P)-dependent oxidoreductase [Chitinophagales bacterium]
MHTNGNTILITGATSGIGLAFAGAFYKEKNTVIICGRRIDRLNALAQKYPGMITRACDVSNDDERKSLAEWVIREHPEVNVLFNNAGVQYAFDLKHETDLKKLKEEIGANLTAPIHLSSLFANHFMKKDHAAICNISSGLAFVPLSFMPVYCATKAAIHSFTMSLRFQLKDTTVSVFEIIPPPVDTELGHDRRADKSQTHGGIPAEEFITEAMEAIRNDIYEYAVGVAKNLREKNEQMFYVLNK